MWQQRFYFITRRVISWTELPNDTALNSRCILIPLYESERSGPLNAPTI